jgi:hypothetical protein
MLSDKLLYRTVQIHYGQLQTCYSCSFVQFCSCRHIQPWKLAEQDQKCCCPSRGEQIFRYLCWRSQLQHSNRRIDKAQLLQLHVILVIWICHLDLRLNLHTPGTQATLLKRTMFVLGLVPTMLLPTIQTTASAV